MAFLKYKSKQKYKFIIIKKLKQKKEQIKMKLKFTNFLLLLFLFTVFVKTSKIALKNRILQAETEQETEDTIRAKIDTKIQERNTATTAYNQVFSDLSSAKIDLYALQQQLIDARMTAQNYYIFFYSTNLKCSGFLASLDLLQSTPQIPPQGCLRYPLALESVDLIILRNQFQAFSQQTQVANKLFQLQKSYLADSKALQSIYSDLVTFFSQSGNTNLRDKYSQLFSVQYNNNFVQNQKLDGRNLTLEAAVGRERQYAAIVKDKYAEIQSQAISCSKSLGEIRTQLTDKMARAKQLQAQVNAKKQFIDQSFTSLNQKTSQIKTITSDLKVLVDQYVAIIQSIQ